MRRFTDLSIRQKLTAMSVLSSGIALVLACAAFLAYELVTFRRAMVQEVATQARMLAYNATPALLFDDDQAAREMLESLQADEHVLAAGLLDTSGRPFARYDRSGGASPAPALAGDSGERFETGRLVLHRPVASGGKRIGVVYVESDVRELDARIARYAGISAIVLAASFLVAIVISSRLQRSISEPVLSLVETAKRVSGERDYSLRATARSGDEVGLLIVAFNEMLAQIQVRDAALETAREDLERRVEERTRDLRQQVRERERAERVLESKARELARSNADLEQFAYVASHDLQEPLRMVGSYTQLLARRYTGKLDSDADEFIGYAVEGVSRMQSLINDLLAYSRVGTRGADFVPTDSERVLAQALRNLEAAVRETGATVTHEPLPEVLGDETQLVQLFQNLIGNAVKFRGEEAPRVAVSARRDRDEWVFSIADNGIGIDPQYGERIFVIFQRLHSRKEYPGTGIGLAICKKIVERHGGRIWFESESGRGTTFRFTIPAPKEISA